MYSSLTNETGVRRESQLRLIFLSGDENMCIVDTDTKLRKKIVGKWLEYIFVWYSDM